MGALGDLAQVEPDRGLPVGADHAGEIDSLWDCDAAQTACGRDEPAEGELGVERVGPGAGDLAADVDGSAAGRGDADDVAGSDHDVDVGAAEQQVLDGDRDDALGDDLLRTGRGVRELGKAAGHTDAAVTDLDPPAVEEDPLARVGIEDVLGLDEIDRGGSALVGLAVVLGLCGEVECSAADQRRVALFGVLVDLFDEIEQAPRPVVDVLGDARGVAGAR